jgi:peptidoglycan endopeptidase LytE
MMRRRIVLWIGMSVLFASLGICREGSAQKTYEKITSPRSEAYIVRKGDTLSAIARKAGTSVDNLRQLNRLRGDALKIGQRLTLKGPSPAPKPIPTEFAIIGADPALEAEEADGAPVTEEAQAEVERHKKHSLALLGKWSSPDEPKLLVKVALGFLGAPYRFGGSSIRGIDCSGLVKKIYAAFNIDLPRTAFEQSRVGMRVSRSELVEGDLLFFNTRRSFGHVGIYIGDNKFIHAASWKRGVRVSSLNESYFNKRFVRAVRLKGSDDSF